MRLYAEALRTRLASLLMLLAVLLGSAHARSEQSAAAQMQHWPAEKILPPEPRPQSLLATHLRRETSRCASAAKGYGADFFLACFWL